MEETIGYEALLSADEWDSLDIGEWTDGTYLLECDVCEVVGSVDTLEEAQAIVRLHESFVATLVESWSVEE